MASIANDINESRKIDQVIKVIIYLNIFFTPIGMAGANITSGLLLLILPIGLYLKDDEVILFQGKLNKAIFSFLFIILLSSLWAFSPYYVLRKFFSPVLQYVLLYYGIINFIENKKELKIVFIFFWIGHFLSASYAINQYFIVGVRRAEGLARISNRLGSIMMIYIIFNFTLLLFAKKVKFKLLGLVGMSIGTLALFATVSRSSLIALVIGLFVVSILKDKRMVAVFLIFILLIAFFIPGHYVERLSELRDLKSSQNARLMMYKTGIEVFKDNPLTGIGFNNIRLTYDELNVLESLRYDHRHWHNIFINVAVELGIFGLLNLIFLLVMVTKKAWDNIKEDKNLFAVAALGVIAGKTFQNSVDILLHTTQVGLVFIIFVAIISLKNKNLLSEEIF